jgi:hypothetical protein
MKTNKIIAIMTILTQTQLLYAKSPIVQSEVTKKAPKGYVLSVDLDRNMGCSNIWSKQIGLFKKNNPKIKNPNMIKEGQLITVQNCQLVLKEAKLEAPAIIEVAAVQEEKKDKEIAKDSSNDFVEVFVGNTHTSETDNDSSKNGKSIGVKLGKDVIKGNKELKFSVGILHNISKTRDENNDKGVYEINSNFLILDSSLLFDLNHKFKAGLKLSALIGDDANLSEGATNQKLGIFGGGELEYKLSTKYSVDLSIQQRIDGQESRTNLLSNLGLKIHF